MKLYDHSMDGCRYMMSEIGDGSGADVYGGDDLRIPNDPAISARGMYGL